MGTVWESLDQRQRQNYVLAIQAMGALSPLFRQKSQDSTDLTAYISPKYQETVFAKAFEGTVVDRGNDPYDVMVPSTVKGKHDLVGIKTFLQESDEMQKIMQFKKIATEEDWKKNYIETKDFQGLIIRIAQVRNARLRSTQNNLAGMGYTPSAAFANIYYHYLTRDRQGRVYVGESPYTFMNEQQLKYTEPKKDKVSSLVFEDNTHQFKYTPADSTLYMRFHHRAWVDNDGELVFEFPVRLADDPYLALLTLYRSLFANVEVSTDLESTNIAPTDLESTNIEPETHPGQDMATELESTVSLQRLEFADDKDEVAEPSDDIVVIPLFHISRRGGVEPGEVPQRSGFNVRMSKPKNKGSDTPRPREEVYLPIPDSKRFHDEYPFFFGSTDTGEPISALLEDGRAKFKNKDERTFTLTLLPSGVVLDAFITGDRLKQIMSRHKQTELGKWLLAEVFQLDEYEPLTRHKLDIINKDAMRLTRLGERSIGLEFIKAKEEDIVNLWPREPELFRELRTDDEISSE